MPIVSGTLFGLSDWPDKPTEAWRFVPIHKFVDLIVNRRVFFSSLLRLRDDDAFEGFYSVGDVENAPPGLDWSEGQAATTYVNCWHAAEIEPAGLWKQYSDPSGGIAIVSDRDRVIGAFGSYSNRVIMGEVAYEAARPTAGCNLFSPVFSKRMNFAHEREIRLCIGEYGAIEKHKITRKFFRIGANGARTELPPGLSVECDVEALIDRVVVGPKTEPWARNAVQTLIERLGCSFKVHESDICGTPALTTHPTPTAP